jgi:hypothetical protein
MAITISLLIALIVAIIAVESVNLVVSVIALGVFGFVSSVAFAFLGAFDVAALQLVTEVFLISLIISWTRTSYAREQYKGREFRAYIAAIIFCIFLMFVLYKAFNSLPSSKTILHLTGNIREFDLFAAGVAIFAATIGVAAMLKPRNKGAEK